MNTIALLRHLSVNFLGICLTILFGSGPLLASESVPWCPQTLQRKLPLVFSPQEQRTLEALRKTATSEEASRYQVRKAQRQLLEWTQERFTKLGFEIQEVVIDDEDSPSGQTTELEILKAPDHFLVARIINRIKEKYQVRVMVDPKLKRSPTKANGYYMEEGNYIVLDLLALKDMRKAPRTLMHEIRHLYFSSLKKKGIVTPYQGDVWLVADDYRLERGNVYNTYMSFEELSTYSRDVSAGLRQVELGDLSRTKFLERLNRFRRLAEVAICHIDMINWQIDSSLIIYEPELRSISYPLFRGPEVEDNIVARVDFEFPDLAADAGLAQALPLLRQRLAEVRRIAVDNLQRAYELIPQFENRTDTRP